jgi:hypothetical protein
LAFDEQQVRSWSTLYLVAVTLLGYPLLDLLTPEDDGTGRGRGRRRLERGKEIVAEEEEEEEMDPNKEGERRALTWNQGRSHCFGL